MLAVAGHLPSQAGQAAACAARGDAEAPGAGTGFSR